MSPDEVGLLLEELDRRIKTHPSVNGKLFEELLSAQYELGLLHGTRPTCPFLRPHFLSAKQYAEITHATQILSKAFERMTEAALSDKSLMDELGLTETEERVARIEPRYKSLCITSRLDAFLSEDGFKFLEYNAESPAGIGDQMQLEKVLCRIPPVDEFLKANPHWSPKPHEKLLESLLAAYGESGGTETNPQIGIIDWKGVSTESEFYVLKDYFDSQGYKTIVADPHDLDFDGKHLYAGNFRIDIFYKRVIIHEFLEKFGDAHPLIEAYEQGRVLMANSFRTKIPHKKSGFAVLSGEHYKRLFSDEQKEMIRRHIPWTRRLKECRTMHENESVDLIPFVRKNRERFVIKPNDDYGGHGIYIGWETNENDWDAHINEALAKDYVVQERVEIKKLSLPVFGESIETAELLVDFNPFIFPHCTEGALIRLSASSLVNITQGGGQTALIVLEKQTGKMEIRTFNEHALRCACDLLAERDADLRSIIAEYGYPPLWKRKQGFATLVHIILEQQVSLASAMAAFTKLERAIEQITPLNFLKLDDAALKSMGFSRQKTLYCRLLAQAVCNGELNTEMLETMQDEDVRERLKSLKGIGDWTADIYLLMALLRADVLPKGDLALLIAAKKLKGFAALPTNEEMCILTENWKPYRAAGTRLLWHFYLKQKKAAY